jgi:hypothetical protein
MKICYFTFRQCLKKLVSKGGESYNAGLSDFFMENDEQMTIKVMPPQAELSMFLAVVSLP